MSAQEWAGAKSKLIRWTSFVGNRVRLEPRNNVNVLCMLGKSLRQPRGKWPGLGQWLWDARRVLSQRH